MKITEFRFKNKTDATKKQSDLHKIYGYYPSIIRVKKKNEKKWSYVVVIDPESLVKLDSKQEV